jgi:hypothetical protein
MGLQRSFAMLRPLCNTNGFCALSPLPENAKDLVSYSSRLIAVFVSGVLAEEPWDKPEACLWRLEQQKDFVVARTLAETVYRVGRAPPDLLDKILCATWDDMNGIGWKAAMSEASKLLQRSYKPVLHPAFCEVASKHGLSMPSVLAIAGNA